MRDEIEQPRPAQRAHTQASRIAIFKHPIHAMLVVYPVALLTLVPAADAVFLVSGEAFWAQVSYWMTLAGVVAGTIAAIAGALDMFLIRVVRRHVAGWNHMLAAVTALAMAAVSLAIRAPDPVQAVWPWGLAIGCIDALMVVVAGWLGGTLTFRHGIGVYGHGGAPAATGDAADADP
jgi:uncharacterized membrane protein